MEENIVLIVMMAIGFVLGIATLPYFKKISADNGPITHVMTFICLWPMLLMYGAWLLIKVYYDDWCYMLSNKQLFFSKNNQDSHGMQEFMKKHESIRKTYFDE